jgi:hypothetical protein
MQRSPMLRRAAEELCCSGSVLHVPLLLLLWTVGCVCALGIVAVHIGLNGELWSSHKPTGKMGLDDCVKCCSKVRCTLHYWMRPLASAALCRSAIRFRKSESFYLQLCGT